MLIGYWLIMIYEFCISYKFFIIIFLIFKNVINFYMFRIIFYILDEKYVN